MPAKSEKQRRFFYLVKAVQKGKASPKRVGSKVAKAASSMSSQDVDDFTHGKNLPKKKLDEIIECLKSLKGDEMGLRGDITGTSDVSGKGPIEPMHLEEEEEDTGEEQNPIAKTFTQQGNFQQYLGGFDGLPFSPKEAEAIYLYKTRPVTPTKSDELSRTPIKFVKYEKTDDFNSTTTIVLKQRQGNDLVFTAFQLSKQTHEAPAEPGKPAEKPEGDNIIVNRSKSFRDDIEGGQILANMLEKLGI